MGDILSWLSHPASEPGRHAVVSERCPVSKTEAEGPYLFLKGKSHNEPGFPTNVEEWLGGASMSGVSRRVFKESICHNLQYYGANSD